MAEQEQAPIKITWAMLCASESNRESFETAIKARAYSLGFSVRVTIGPAPDYRIELERLPGQ